MLGSIWKYRHLADPSATLRYTGKSDSAPSGKWALSDDPKVNMALWNTLGVTAVTAPTAAALTLLANKYWDKWLQKRVTERSLAKINAMRPQMSPNDDLEYTYNITTKPKKELMKIIEQSQELSKNASAADDSRMPKLIGDSFAASLPIIAAPTAAYLTIRAVQDAHKKRLRKKLLDERIAIRNMQDKVDHEILKEQGLVKDASMSTEEAERIWDMHGKDKDKEPLFYSALTAPLAIALGASALGGVMFYNKLTDSDKYKNRLHYLRDHILGSNTLQDAPRISLAKFTKDNAGMTARPGDKVATLIEEEIKPVKSLEEVLVDEPKALEQRTGLEEVTTTDLSTDKKSDALF